MKTQINKICQCILGIAQVYESWSFTRGHKTAFDHSYCYNGQAMTSLSLISSLFFFNVDVKR